MQALNQCQRLLLIQIFIEARRLAGLEQRAQLFAIDCGTFGNGARQLVTARHGTKSEPFAERVAEALVSNINGNVAGARMFVELAKRAHILQRREPRLRPRGASGSATPRKRNQHGYAKE